MLSIDKLAYISALRNINPMEKFLFSMITLIVCIALSNPLTSIVILVFMSWLIVFKGKLSTKIYLKLIMLPFTFLLIGVLTIAINVVRDNQNAIIFFTIYDTKIGCTYYSILLALNIFLKALASVSCLYFLILTTPVFEVLIVLRKIKLPKLFVELMGLIYRFIFVLLDKASMIFISQNSRLGYSDVRTGYNSLAKLITSLFISSYKRSQDIYTAMEARGYDGEIELIDSGNKLMYIHLVAIAFFEITLIILGILVRFL